MLARAIHPKCRFITTPSAQARIKVSPPRRTGLVLKQLLSAIEKNDKSALLKVKQLQNTIEIDKMVHVYEYLARISGSSVINMGFIKLLAQNDVNWDTKLDSILIPLLDRKHAQVIVGLLPWIEKSFGTNALSNFLAI